MLDDLVWSGPSGVDALNDAMVDVVKWMNKTDTLEEFISRYDIDPSAFREHVETKIYEVVESYKAKAGEDELPEWSGLYILGVLTGILLSERKDSKKAA